MSPAKKSLKTVALPIAKLGFTNVHRISQGSYRGWLGALLQSKPNQKLFLKHEKDVVDQCFREQAMQEYALENNRLKQALAGINQEASKAFWSRWRASLGLSHPKAVEEASFEIAAGLTLPKIGQKMRQTSSSDRLECETYENFAQHAERKNPDTVFTKELMDAAFRKAVSRVGPTTLSWKGGTSGVITQCLGKESTKY